MTYRSLLTDARAKASGICCLLRHGHTLLLSLRDLCPGPVAQSEKVCAALHLGERLLPVQVSLSPVERAGPFVKEVGFTEDSFSYSFCFLLGPLNYLKSLFTAERRCFTVSYFATLIATLYCALHLQSTPLTVLFAVLQLIAMLSFLVSHIPGGTKGLMFFTRIFKSSVNSTLPV